MLDRHIVSENFRYRSNEFNFRSGFMEETTVKRNVLFTRIDYWRNVFVRHLKLKPNNNLQIHITQTSLDIFALYLGAIECDLNLVTSEPDLIIHNIPDSQLEERQFDQYRNYNYFDLSDIRFNDNCDYVQQGTSIIYGTSCSSIDIKNIDLNGIVLHTKYCVYPQLVTEFMFPALACSDVESHMGLGYNNLDEGMIKISKIIGKHGISCVLIPTSNGVFVLNDILENYNYDINSLKVFTYDKQILSSDTYKKFDIAQDEFLKSIPKKFNIDGDILYDLESDALYFQFNYEINSDVAELKVKAMNSLLNSKIKKRITKWRYLIADTEEAIAFFRYV